VCELIPQRARAAVVAGFVAALAAGVVDGVIARLLMRLYALSAGIEPHFSVVGSLGILIIFILAVLPGSIAAAWTRRWPSRVLVATGLIFLSYSAVVIGVEESAGITGLTTLRMIVTALVVAALAAVIVAHSFLAPLLARRMASRLTSGRALNSALR
jgi:hypothetical protein